MARIAAFAAASLRYSHPARRCRSSVVEHSLGKGEVVSSILTGSTRKSHCAHQHGDLTALVCRTGAATCERSDRLLTPQIRFRARAYVGIASSMPNTRFQLGDDGQLTRARRNEPQSPSDVAMSGGTKTTAIGFPPARFEHLANGRGVDADTDGGTDRGDPALGPDLAPGRPRLDRRRGPCAGA